jgi:hypothetical protein
MYKIYVLWVLTFLSFVTFAQQPDDKIKVSGKITNYWTGEGIAGASIIIKSTHVGTTTNEHGEYIFYTSPGRYVITFSSVGYISTQKDIDVIKNVVVNIELKDDTYNLEEVEVLSERENANVLKAAMGRNTISGTSIRSIPAFMGEIDVVRGLLTLPGVSSVGEGSVGFNVRGGGVDQNLILQDGVLLFNPSHVFGFFSAFNGSMVKSTTLHKNSLPSKFGGRLSSVLEVNLQEGDYKNYTGEVGLGLGATKFLVSGPVLKERLSFAVGARISHLNWMLSIPKSEDVNNSKVDFQDYNVKLSYLLGDKSKLAYSGYYSNDGFRFPNDTLLHWSTLNHSLLYQNNISDNLGIDVTLAHGAYQYDIGDEVGFDAYKIESYIKHSSAKIHTEYFVNDRLTVNGGVDGILYQFSPGVRSAASDLSKIEPKSLQKEKSIEASVYLEMDYSLFNRMNVIAGLRYSQFYTLGGGVQYVYDGYRSIPNLTDTLYYGNNEVINHYGGVEPRLSFMYQLTPFSSLKGSYNRTRQYIHLISNTASSLPTDIWKPSSRYFEPETMDQLSIGYFRNMRENMFEFSAELFYKWIEGIVDYRDGAKLVMNDALETELLTGTSNAYGLELYINKRKGKWTGWSSYTFSRVFRQIDGGTKETRINNGDPYPANYDKPHNFALTINNKPNPVFEFGATFTYSTGRPVTVPNGIYATSNMANVFAFSSRNGGRIPDYHRLDLSATFYSKPHVDRKVFLSWTVAVYNVYARKNAYSVFYENKEGAPPKAYKFSVLGSAFPSMSLNINFK